MEPPTPGPRPAALGAPGHWRGPPTSRVRTTGMGPMVMVSTWSSAWHIRCEHRVRSLSKWSLGSSVRQELSSVLGLSRGPAAVRSTSQQGNGKAEGHLYPSSDAVVRRCPRQALGVLQGTHRGPFLPRTETEDNRMSKSCSRLERNERYQNVFD